MSIAFLIVFICLSVLLTSIIKYKNVYNPLTIFSGIWMFIFILYIGDPSNLPSVKDSTLFLFLVGIVSFILGSYFVRLKKIKNLKGVVYIDNFHNKQLILLIQIIGTVVSIYLGSFGVAAVLSGQDLTFIRYTLRLVTLKNSINAILLTYVSVPIMYFSITYSCAQIASQNYSRYIKWSVFLSFIMMIMELLTSGGRMGIFYAVTCSFIAFFENRKQSERKGKKKMSLLPLVITGSLGIGMMFMMADSRSSGNGLDSTYVYLYGPISCFEADKEIFDQPSYHYTYGLLTFQGFISPIASLLSLSKTEAWKNLDKVSVMIDDVVDLNGRDFNSEVTMFGYFYFDGGLFCVFLFSFFLGFLSQYLYKKFCSSKQIQLSFLFLYMIVVGNVALSFLHITFTAVGYALSIVLMFLLRRNVKYKKRYENTSISSYAEANKLQAR